jgi:hypothetical protein
MRFTFEGRRYELDFSRERKDVVILRDGTKHTIKSLHPYTTVSLKERIADALPATVATATVGCLPTDRYSNDLGRVYALRALTQVLTKKHGKSKEFKAAMWRAYELRYQPNVLEGVLVKSEPVEPPTAETIH